MIPRPPRSTPFPYTPLFRSSTRLNSSHGSISYAVFWRSDVCRSEEHTSELQSRYHLGCRLLLSHKQSHSPHLTFVNDTATTELYTLSLHAALPICTRLNSSHGSISYAVFWSSDVCRSEEHTSELQSRQQLVCRLPLENKKIQQ